MKQENLIRLYGDLENSVWVAPKGSTMPTALTALAAPFNEVGWISEDGVTEAIEQSDETFRAWQGATVVRKSITSSDRTFTFSALETNAVTQGLKYRGQVPTVATGVSKITVKDQTKNDERAWVIDLFDGEFQKRYVIPKGFYVISGEQAHNASGPTVLEITIHVIGEYQELSTAAV